MEKERETTNLELIYTSKQDLKELSSTDEWKSFIVEDSLKSIRHAIKNNLDKIQLFNIFNLSLMVEVEKPYYKDVLENITQYYISEENYEMCNEIKKIIKTNKL